MDKFDFGDAVKNDFGNGPAWSDVEKNDFGNGPSWMDKLDFSKSDPVPDWPGDDPETADSMLSIEGIEYGKTTGDASIEGVEFGKPTGQNAIEGVEFGADSDMGINPLLGLAASSTVIDDGYF